MAFNIRYDQSQSHPLAAATPDVPEPKPLPQGDMLGGALLSAFVQRAIASERNSLEQQRAIQNADMEAKQLELAKKTEADNFKIAKQNADSIAKYRASSGIGGIAGQLAVRRYLNQQEKTKDMLNYQNTVEENDNRFDNAVRDEYPILLDAGRQQSEPLEWLQAYNDLQGRFGTAAVGKAPRQLKKFATQADQMKVPFLHGAKQDASGAFVSNQQIQPVPLDQIVRQWQNPDLRESIKNGLMGAGHGKIVKQLTEGFKVLGHTIPGTGGEKTTVEPDPYASKIIGGAGKVKYGRQKSEVPEVLTRPSNVRVEQYGGGGPDSIDSIPSETPSPLSDVGEEPDILPGNEAAGLDEGPKTGMAQPVFTPTKTDTILGHARNALTANPAARNQIFSRLQEMGIDPSLLSA